MALHVKMETEVEIKATAKQFYHALRTPPHQIPTICSNIVAAELHKGEWHAHGSTGLWTYKFDGKTETFKEKILFEDENKKFTKVGVEGDVFKHFKIFNISCQAIPKAGGEGGIVKLVIEYEKLKKDIPSPDDYLEFLVGFIAEIDAHLSKA